MSNLTAKHTDTSLNKEEALPPGYSGDLMDGISVELEKERGKET
jgi:hypothetical protein